LRAARRHGGSAAGGERAAQFGEAATVELDLAVHRDHGRGIDGSRQALQRPDVDALAHQQHRVVLGKEGAIVLEHPEAEAAELGIGRVDVDHVDLARRHGVVRQAMVEAGRRRRQCIGLAQRRPAVGTLQELVRQTELQRPALRRGKVGDARNAQALRLRFAHRQRIGVVEAERHRRHQAARRQPAVELLERRVALALEQLTHDRAGVLGIEVDRPAGECLLEDAGVAQALAMHRRPAGSDQGLGDDLAEHVRLGEALRTDDHAGLFGRREGLATGDEQGGDEECL
jgi:hypothetical protein